MRRIWVKLCMESHCCLKLFARFHHLRHTNGKCTEWVTQTTHTARNWSRAGPFWPSQSLRRYIPETEQDRCIVTINCEHKHWVRNVESPVKIAPDVTLWRHRACTVNFLRKYVALDVIGIPKYQSLYRFLESESESDVRYVVENIILVFSCMRSRTRTWAENDPKKFPSAAMFTLIGYLVRRIWILKAHDWLLFA